MTNHIPQFVQWLLRLLLPGAGRHRDVETTPSVRCMGPAPLRVPRVQRYRCALLVCAHHDLAVIK
ncbi:MULTISPECIES: hypothetical protein [Streptomyces]|uniref:hypothetical protein n=1 Tax=Streptomyces TaxID=1883 RepID=UPI00117CF32B|nr:MULTISPECIES: hypothetical protein [Streptomyces]